MAKYIASYEAVPIDFVRGEGCYLFDKKGKKYIDFLGGWCVSTVGWKNREMAAAISRQASEGIYVPPIFGSARQEALAKRLVELAPGKLRRVFRSTSGSEAVEYGIMCVRAASGKPTVVSIDGVYHGHTYGAAALGDACIPKLGPCPPGFIKLRMPKTIEDGVAVVAEFERLVVTRGDIAAFMSEPFWTNAGCHRPPEGFYQGIQRVCRKHGVLLAMDEVATGMGRSGKMYASELWGLTPDVICLGKSFTGGYATMGATLVTEDVFRKSR
ncbi:MAG: acetylornithine aminotransferase, partial [Candidatus Parcubacteria bacterium]